MKMRLGLPAFLIEEAKKQISAEEESFEDVFILNRKQDALQFNVSDTIPSA